MPFPCTFIVDDLAAQGDGVAHVDGLTVFVAGALPGERVRVAPWEKEGTIRRARLLEVLEPSPTRTPPACPHFARCGGCALQHLEGKAYAAFKVGQLEKSLTHKGTIEPFNLPFEPLLTSPPGTRRRARLAARHTKNGLIFGFNEARSPTIVDVMDCAVLAPALKTALPILREHLALWLPLGATCDVQLTALPAGLDVVIIGGTLDLEGRERLGALAQALGAGRLSWRKWDKSPLEPIAALTTMTVTFGETTVPFPPGSFLQATPEGERALTAFVRAHVPKGARVLDLFCGLGTFGLSLEAPTRLHMADLDGPAVEALEHATREARRTITVETRNLIRDPVPTQECNSFDCVIFDPPRGGAKAQATAIAQSHVPTVLAISCDPPSFIRDAQILIDGGYTLKALQPVDQFLWSPHLELAAWFDKRT